MIEKSSQKRQREKQVKNKFWGNKYIIPNCLDDTGDRLGTTMASPLGTVSLAEGDRPFFV